SPRPGRGRRYRDALPAPAAAGQRGGSIGLFTSPTTPATTQAADATRPPTARPLPRSPRRPVRTSAPMASPVATGTIPRRPVTSAAIASRLVRAGAPGGRGQAPGGGGADGRAATAVLRSGRGVRAGPRCSDRGR